MLNISIIFVQITVLHLLESNPYRTYNRKAEASTKTKICLLGAESLRIEVMAIYGCLGDHILLLPVFYSRADTPEEK